MSSGSPPGDRLPCELLNYTRPSQRHNARSCSRPAEICVNWSLGTFDLCVLGTFPLTWRVGLRPVIGPEDPAPAKSAPATRASATRASALPRLPAVAPWVAAGLGCAGAVAAGLARPDEARSAAGQDWPPFVLVSGLLLVGLVADEDGLFAAAGHALARLARNGIVLYAGAVLLIATVTTLLNLDTSVAFLTPILVYTARSRGEGEAPLLYGCILLSNAGSLLLPGSNLTNLIVLGQVHLSGGHFFREMAPAGVAAIIVTAAVVGLAYHRSLRTTATVSGQVEKPVLGTGLVAIAAATIFVLVLHSPALPVAVVGVAAVLLKARSWPGQGRRAFEVLGVPVLLGLFGIAVSLGTLGRVWSGPCRPAPPPWYLGDSRTGGSAHSARKQPSRRLPVGVAPTSKALRVVDRAEHWAKPVHHRVAGVGLVVESSVDGASPSVGLEGHPSRADSGAVINCCRLGRVESYRAALTAGPARSPPHAEGRTACVPVADVVPRDDRLARNFSYYPWRTGVGGLSLRRSHRGGWVVVSGEKGSSHGQRRTTAARAKPTDRECPGDGGGRT